MADNELTIVEQPCNSTRYRRRRGNSVRRSGGGRRHIHHSWLRGNRCHRPRKRLIANAAASGYQQHHQNTMHREVSVIHSLTHSSANPRAAHGRSRCRAQPLMIKNPHTRSFVESIITSNSSPFLCSWNNDTPPLFPAYS
jgi:hypothetical protein